MDSTRSLQLIEGKIKGDTFLSFSSFLISFRLDFSIINIHIIHNNNQCKGKSLL